LLMLIYTTYIYMLNLYNGLVSLSFIALKHKHTQTAHTLLALVYTK